MTATKLALLQPTDAHWPTQLVGRLGASAPRVLQAIGPVTLLAARRTALFCSARPPGDAILRAHDTARRLRDEGVTVISGFHSPIEKDCLRILLRGTQPIIVCPAPSRRCASRPNAAPPSRRAEFCSSPRSPSSRSASPESALRRNEVVAALADRVFIAHITPGGRTEQIAEMLRRWGVRSIPNG